MRIRPPKKKQQSNSQVTIQPQLLQRPFDTPGQTEQAVNLPATQQQSQKPEWSFGNISVFSPERSPCTIPIQPKLTIGQPNDKHEQEADRVATQVVQRINAPTSDQATTGKSVQRQSEPEEEELQAKRDTSVIQRQKAISGGEASADLASGINSARGGGQPLEASLQRSMGQAMGADFSRVRVHTNTQSDQLNQSIQAKAFTTGQDVFFRQGAYQPGNRGGQELIAHELTHVVQQNGGAVQRSEGRKENLQNKSSVQTRSEKLTIQRDTVFHKARRIVGRWINNKQLPVNTYRWDTRLPAKIANSGFQPWNANGNIRLEEHVNNAFASGEQQGQQAKYESQWVSTGAYGMLKKLDPTFAQQVLNTYLYKIDTTTAKTTGEFSDANDYFDKINKDRPYASQREWIKLGGIPPEAVVKWMRGKDFVEQYDIDTGAPNENELTGWKAMPKQRKYKPSLSTIEEE